MANPPDFGFEIELRRLICDNLRLFDETASYVNDNPRFSGFLVQYNSYQQYIRDVGSAPDSMSFIDVLVCFELLIKQELILEKVGDSESSVPIAVGLLKQLLTRVDRPVGDVVSEEVKKVLDKLDSYEANVKNIYNTELKEGLSGLNESNDKISQLFRVLVGDPTDLPAIQKMITASESKIKGAISSLDKDLTKKLKEISDDFIKKSEDYKKEIIETVCEEIPNRVVGESYYRYNATSQFYPTLVLVFVEETESKYPRRSQLKVKIKKTSEEIDDAFVNKLKNDFLVLNLKRYRYGKLRACYVSSDKSYKNTIFTSSLEQAAQVFRNVYKIVNLPFDAANISITSGRNRKPITRRQRPLDGLVPETADYGSEFEANLYRVVLQVNGLPKPILIYKNYRV